MPLLNFRAATSGGDNTLSVSSVSATAPTTVSGDLEIMWAGAGVLAPAVAPTIATPSGWTLRGTSGSVPIVGGALNTRIHLFTRIATGAGSSATLNAGVNAAFAWNRLTYSGPNLTDEFGQVIFGNAGSGTSLVVSSLTTTEDDALVVAFVSQGAAQTITPPGSMTERVDNATYGASTADEQRPTAGATGTRTFTLPSATDAAWGFAEFFSAAAHSTSGALVGQGSTVSGSAARTRAHASSGALTGSGSTVAGSAERTRQHASSGDLTGQGSTVAGSAARTRQHAATGALAGQGSAVSGSADRTRQHAASGALVGPGAAVSGSAERTRQHGSSGDLVGPGAVIVGSADHITPGGTHDATGALVGPGSSVSGSAARFRAFTSSGALVGPGSVVTGSANRAGAPVSHDATGVLVGPGSSVSGVALLGEEQTLVGGFMWMLRRRKAWEDALRNVPEPVAEVIKTEAPKVIEKPKAQARNELRKALEAENLPYRAAYTQALERLVQQMRQEQEDDEEEESIAEALALLL